VLRCALTIDDAPSPSGDAGSALMDAMRRTLECHGVKRCVAFVIGERVPGHEAELERWLAAGYELGNHSHEHAAATHLPERAVGRSFERCHAELERLGAFTDGRARYARLPFGDRGKTPADRDAIRRSILSLGYTLADVSINLNDFIYAPLLESALADACHADAAEVERRFAAQARAAILRSRQVTTLQTARGAVSVPGDFAHVIALHFVPGTERFLERMLSAWSAHVGWISLAEAVHHDMYSRFGGDPAHNGVIAGALRGESSLARDLALRLTRRGASVARRLRIGGRTGPRWPHWTL
jgi:peptidoglycan/xylan/chitin deacetylase (PgdA/CDA1 family)